MLCHSSTPLSKKQQRSCQAGLILLQLRVITGTNPSNRNCKLMYGMKETDRAVAEVVKLTKCHR